MAGRAGGKGGDKVWRPRKWGETVTHDGPRAHLPMTKRGEKARGYGSGVRVSLANWNSVRRDGVQWKLHVPPRERSSRVGGEMVLAWESVTLPSNQSRLHL